MAHQSLKLIPGVDQNRTLALNEAAISDTNLIRFIPDRQQLGLVQKLGGWQKYFANSFSSIIRNLWAWEDINSNSWLAVGAEQSLNVISDNNSLDITPQTTVTSESPVSFTTVAGSSTVIVDDVGSGLDAYDVANITTQVSVGGLILFGLYTVTPITTDQYSIEAKDIFGNPAYATASVSGGGAVASFALTTGTAAIEVTLADHGLSVGSTFPILVATSIGSLTLFGNYIVQSLDAITPLDKFTITASTAATSTPTLTATGNGVTATLTYISNYVIPVGSTITVAGVTPAGFNATAVVTASSAGSVSYLNATAGPQTVAGTIFVDVAAENGGSVGFIYYNGFGPGAANAGYGVGGYGTGGYGSGVAGTSSPGTPITTADWTLDNWGETLIACPLDGAIYEWSPTANNPIATVLPYAPQVNHGILVAMPQRQIIAWGSTFNGVQDPLLLRWCDVNNYDTWIAQIGNQAGSFRIPKGSKILQCIQGPQQTIVWTDLGIWAMQYVGPPYIYQFNEIGTGCGIIGGKAGASVGGVVYWMGQSQFYRIAGGGVEPIPCPIWDVIFQDLDRDNLDKIRVAPNSRFGEITWYYPTLTAGGEISNYVKYNFVLNQWDFGALARTAWINESVLGPPIGAGSDKFIYQHETSTDAAGAAMNSYYQTGYFALSDGDMKMFIDQIWPDMKWGYFDGSQNAVLSITFYVADYPGQTPLTFGPYTMTQATTFITPRLRGRLVSIKIESNDTGSFWRSGNLRYRIQPDGRY